MKSNVHPTYKTRYRVGNWRAYERALVRRADVTLWLSAGARAAWAAPPSGRPGGQPRFSDLAIETALTLRLVFRLPLRQTEGFVRSVLVVMHAGLDAPDHTTLSRRSQRLDVGVHAVPATGPAHLLRNNGCRNDSRCSFLNASWPQDARLIVDSTGLSIVGEGEWAVATRGGRGTRGWKTLHLGVDRSGVIVAQVLTEATVDDAAVGIDLIGAAPGDLASVTGDGAYDTVGFYEAADVNADGTDGQGVSKETTVECPRSNDRRRGNAGGAHGRRPRATIGGRVWRTPSFGTRPSSEPVFAPVVEGGGASKRALPATC